MASCLFQWRTRAISTKTSVGIVAPVAPSRRNRAVVWQVSSSQVNILSLSLSLSLFLFLSVFFPFFCSNNNNCNTFCLMSLFLYSFLSLGLLVPQFITLTVYFFNSSILLSSIRYCGRGAVEFILLTLLKMMLF